MPHPDATFSRDPDRLANHVEDIAGLAVQPTAITFDQLVSGRIPDDAPTDDMRDFVAIVHFEDNKTPAKWVPHVCIPQTGLFLPTSTGHSTHLGTIIQEKCTEEKMDNREKAATNVAQLTMKEVGGPRQTCPRCLIFYLCKVQKQRGKKRKHREEP